MRIRYERREPRAEDIREIQELKSVIEAQDRDLRLLTEKLREFQMHRNGIIPCEPPQYDQDEMMLQAQQQQQQPPLSPSSMMRKVKKPLLNCDVIYEAENEEEDEAQTISAWGRFIRAIYCENNTEFRLVWKSVLVSLLFSFLCFYWTETSLYTTKNFIWLYFDTEYID